MVIALSRFIVRSTDECRPCFQALKKGKDLKHTKECESVFQKNQEMFREHLDPVKKEGG